MSIPEVQEIVGRMSVIERSKLYGHYLCKMIALKHSYAIMETISENNKVVRASNSEDFRLRGDIKIVYLWKNMHIMSSEEFNRESVYTWYYKFFA